MVVAIGKGIDRAHGKSDMRPGSKTTYIGYASARLGVYANRGHEWYRWGSRLITYCAGPERCGCTGMV